MKKQHTALNLQNQTFRIRFSKEELDILLRVLYHEVSYIKKNQKRDLMAFQWQQYHKDSLNLMRLYSQPMNKERKMFEHTIKSLDLLLGMLEVHLYDTLKDSFSIKLYERLCKIYQKQKNHHLSSTAER